MRAGAEREPFRGVAGDVETIAIAKTRFVAIGRAEHEEHAVFRLEIDAAIAPLLRHSPRRHSDRRDPARIFLEHVDPLRLALGYPRKLLGMGQQRPDRA